MSDYLDAQLDGTLCSGCGVFLGRDGYPGYCKDCETEHEERVRISAKFKKDTQCPHCGKKLAWIGLEQHIRAKHSATTQPQAQNTDG